MTDHPLPAPPPTPRKDHPYHRNSLWCSRGVSPPLVVIVHSYYALSWGWHVAYQFRQKGSFYSLPEDEFNLLFKRCQECESHRPESFFSKIASRWQRLFSTAPHKSSTER